MLTLQNVVMYLVARYSQSGGKASDGKMYLKTTVVLMQEVLKLCACIVLVSIESGIGGMVDLVKNEIFGKFFETLKVGVPALLYFFQVSQSLSCRAVAPRTHGGALLDPMTVPPPHSACVELRLTPLTSASHTIARIRVENRTRSSTSAAETSTPRPSRPSLSLRW
jgi:hypothetical protein